MPAGQAMCEFNSACVLPTAHSVSANSPRIIYTAADYSPAATSAAESRVGSSAATQEHNKSDPARAQHQPNVWSRSSNRGAHSEHNRYTPAQHQADSGAKTQHAMGSNQAPATLDVPYVMKHE